MPRDELVPADAQEGQVAGHRLVHALPPRCGVAGGDVPGQSSRADRSPPGRNFDPHAVCGLVAGVVGAGNHTAAWCGSPVTKAPCRSPLPPLEPVGVLTCPGLPAYRTTMRNLCWAARGRRSFTTSSCLPSLRNSAGRPSTATEAARSRKSRLWRDRSCVARALISAEPRSGPVVGWYRRCKRWWRTS